MLNLFVKEQSFVYVVYPFWKTLELMMLVFKFTEKLRLWILSQHFFRKEGEEKCCYTCNLGCQGRLSLKSE